MDFKWNEIEGYQRPYAVNKVTPVPLPSPTPASDVCEKDDLIKPLKTSEIEVEVEIEADGTDTKPAINEAKISNDGID